MTVVEIVEVDDGSGVVKVIDVGVGGGGGGTGPAGPAGPAGPPGPPGASTALFPYSYNATTSAPPANSQVRSNGATAATTTVIWVHRSDTDAKDEKILLLLASTGDDLFIQDKSDSTVNATFTLTSNPIDNTDYVTYNVAYQSGTGTLVGKSVLLGIIREGSQGPPGPGVPVGGTANQVLSKNSATDYDTSWKTPSSGGGGLSGPTGTQTFSFAASAQTFVVPAGVTSIVAILKGASGQCGTSNGTFQSPLTNSLGAQATATIAVTPGETLNIYTGGQPLNTTTANITGGFNGGGNGGNYDGSWHGGGGGGATDIRQGGTALANRVVVAGGGGGSSFSNDPTRAGGNAGLIGTDGGGVYGGKGGGSAAGGAAGGGTGTLPTAGSLGTGGTGGQSNVYCGGGGGGGYYGGGGGGGDQSPSYNFSGGGGGSSLVPAGGSVVSGVNTGNGSVVLKWGTALNYMSVDVLWDAKGDLAVGTGDDTATKLGVGSNNQVLTADSTTPSGLKWAVPSGVSPFTFTATKTSAYTANANEYIPVDATSGSVAITLPAAPANGTRVAIDVIANPSSNTVTVTRSGSDIIGNPAGTVQFRTLTITAQKWRATYNAGCWYEDIRNGYTSAANVPITPTATLTSTNVQNALQELDGDIQTGTFPGVVTGTAFSSTGLTGATSGARFVGATASGPPTTGTFIIGDWVIDRSGQQWICTTAGSPGTWTAPGSGRELAYAEVTADQSVTAIGAASRVDITGLSVTFTPSSRPVMIQLWTRYFFHTTPGTPPAANGFNIAITDNANAIVADCGGNASASSGSPNTIGSPVKRLSSLTPGTPVTYKGMCYCVTAATATFKASTSGPAFLRVWEV